MRVALFSGNYNYLREGANQALNRLARDLEADGHEVRAYSPVTDRPAFEPAGTLVPVPSIPLPVRSEFRLSLGLPRAVREDVRRFAPDIVHLSTPDILGTRAQTFARRLGIPTVASLHTRFEAYLDYYGLGWAGPLVEAHLRRFYRRCDHVLAPTPALVAAMKAMRGDDQVSLWSRGVDRALFNPARRDPEWRRSNGWSDEDVVVLFFGRLVAEKGIDRYVSTLRQLQRRSTGIRALAVGAGPAAGAFDALPGAVLTGHLDGAELVRAVASADILLHPSTTETFGNVVLEAMASGLAVVCARTDSAEALVEHGRTGILCAPDDCEGYRQAILALAEDPRRRSDLGEAARRSSEAFSWSNASRSVAQAYRDVLGRRRRR
ncbi:MAG TPA: glycosyltransferase family 1 protein [Sphingomicrobium sp.]|nr:glycosyltransferase family 1 protein [Sphingomicrobium sp.]